MFSHNPFERLQRLPIFTPEMEEEMRRSLLSNQIFSRLETRLPSELDAPRPIPYPRNEDSQIAKPDSSFSWSTTESSYRVDQERLERIDEQMEQLKEETMRRLENLFHRFCLPFGTLGFAQLRLSPQAEQCVASVAISLGITLEESFGMCDRFLSRHNISWDSFAHFIANGFIRGFEVVNNELVLVAQEPLILRDDEVSLRMARGIERGTGLNQVKSEIIGDATCKFNARSPHLRCAINPCGPCKDCSHREENQP